MKTIIVLILVCFSLISQAADEKPAPDTVVVKVLDTQLPHEENKRDMFLWDNFANKPEEKRFSNYPTDKWKDTFAVFAKALIRKADEAKLDSVSLHKALDLLLKGAGNKIAYLPVGAYQTTLDGQPVWIIVIKWEYPLAGGGSTLGHIRAFAFDQKTLKQVGFVTCG